ncbi:hypothetical protein [Actinoallomurus acaciae]|uniref:Uncharacterized protein n=1 Tax=Actinoallomurus acaciae TaxID=502577 RepID=A0ABV5YBK1_9ACTN
MWTVDCAPALDAAVGDVEGCDVVRVEPARRFGSSRPVQGACINLS